MEYTPARPSEDKRGLGAGIRHRVKEFINGSKFPGYELPEPATQSGEAPTPQTSPTSADDRIKFGNPDTTQYSSESPTNTKRIVWGNDVDARLGSDTITDTTESNATRDIVILRELVSQVITETTNETALREFALTLSRITAIAEDTATTAEQLEDLINSLRTLKESVIKNRDSSGSETDMFLHDRLQAPLYQAETRLTSALNRHA